MHYLGEETYARGGIMLSDCLPLNTEHKTAARLSKMYSCGMSTEEIKKYDVLHMKQKDFHNVQIPVYDAILPVYPRVEVTNKIADLGWPYEWDEKYL